MFYANAHTIFIFITENIVSLFQLKYWTTRIVTVIFINFVVDGNIMCFIEEKYNNILHLSYIVEPIDKIHTKWINIIESMAFNQLHEINGTHSS